MKRCVLLGDRFIGKTSFIEARSKDIFHDFKENPCYPRCYQLFEEINHLILPIQFIDFDGDESNDHMSLIFGTIDIFLLCFSVASRSSLKSIFSKWIYELINSPGFTRNSKIILIGLQTDKIDYCPGDECVLHFEGEAFAERIGASFYAECSAKTGKDLEQVFMKIFQLAYSNKLEAK